MAKNERRRTVLGLDLGVTSVGWAIVKFAGDKPVDIIAMGVRHFDTAATNAKEFNEGRHNTKNADRRRPQRQMRRQTDRRKQRKIATFKALQQAGLLPAASARTEDQRHKVIRQIDGSLRRQWMAKGDHRKQQLLPYLLRDAASRRKVSAEELGRALYHLAQRRGFKSNRKTDRDDDERSKVYDGIGTLEQEMQTASCETYGQYFATLDPREIEQRIRGRYTSRAMYEAEFDKIIEAQLPHHPYLADHAKRIRRAIFYQRPLKSQRHLLGKCELEDDRRRAPKACLEFQRYRVYQQVNNLSLELPTGHKLQLTPDQRETLYEALEENEKLTVARIVKTLGFKRNSGYSVEGIGESGKEIIGNRTGCKLREVLGEDWATLGEERQIQLVDEIIQFTNPDALARRLNKVYGLSYELARGASRVHLDKDYASFSRVALKKLLPLLRAGHTLNHAIKEVYGEKLVDEIAVGKDVGVGEALGDANSGGEDGQPRIPPLSQTRCGRQVRNPVVMRCLSELRKVVNHIIRDPLLGKPDEIRIELMRDLKRSKKVRKERHEKMKKNKDRNQQIRKLLVTQHETKSFFAAALPEPRDVDKWKLYEECDRTCPYTGRYISPGDLFGPAPQFDIEHIIPASRFPDNSLANKTLCALEENRQRKMGRTPEETYGGTDQYDQILRRVKGFKGPFAKRKLELFRMGGIPKQMTGQQLVDSQYSAALAASYLGELYGGQVDAAGRRRVVATNGRVTSHLRGLWRLNEIIGSEAGQKNRADLRHHAIDALVVALSGPATVARLARFVQEGERLGLANPFAARHHRRAKAFEPPWEGFLEQAADHVLSINVSHRPQHRLRGQLHEDKMHGAPDGSGTSSKKPMTLRVKLTDLDRKTIEGDAFVSPFVQHCVLEKLRSFDAPGRNAHPKTVFKDDANLPVYPARDGQPAHVIRRVKVYRSASNAFIARKSNAKGLYKPGGNHHVPILVEVDDNGNEKRDQQGRLMLKFGDVVSRFDAMRRWASSEDVVRGPYLSSVRVEFTLMVGDVVEMSEGGQRILYRLLNMSNGDFQYRSVHLAEGTKSSLNDRKDLFLRITSERDFSIRSPRKVIVDPLGRVYRSGG